jgi:hypothetical protein
MNFQKENHSNINPAPPAGSPSFRFTAALAALGCVLPLAALTQTPAKSANAAPAANHQVAPHTFAPLDKARLLAGELIAVDSINRCGMIRDDRTDDQNRAHWDRSHPFALLPYAKVMYHGAPADLRDIPLGTHLHGAFFEGPPVPQYPAAYVPSLGLPGRISKYIEFSRVACLEDDFSRDVRLGRLWKVDAVDFTAGKLTLTALEPRSQSAGAAPLVFDIGPDTRIWQGRGFTGLDALQPGQKVLFNLTMATMYGPGRITDLWLDAESRAAAIAHQTEKHRRFQRERGLAGWIDTVDNATGTLGITIFGGVDPALLGQFTAMGVYRVATASEQLRVWDPVNDSKPGTGVVTRVTSTGDGDSGVRIHLVVGKQGLQEGHRPGHFVRLWPGDGKNVIGWPVRSAPREERLMDP